MSNQTKGKANEVDANLARAWRRSNRDIKRLGTNPSAKSHRTKRDHAATATKASPKSNPSSAKKSRPTISQKVEELDATLHYVLGAISEKRGGGDPHEVDATPRRKGIDP